MRDEMSLGNLYKSSCLIFHYLTPITQNVHRPSTYFCPFYNGPHPL